MKLSGHAMVRFVTVAAVGAALALAPLRAEAQAPPVPRKTPGGPFVSTLTQPYSAEAGRDIQWTIAPITNASPNPGVFTFRDRPDGGGTQECEAGFPGGSQETPASNTPAPGWLQFPDEGDGTCDAFVTVAAPASGYTINCTVNPPFLEITNINLGAFQQTSITFLTTLDPTAAVGAFACNWGHIIAPGGGGSDTYPYGTGNVPGCSCVLVAMPSGFDIEVTKTGRIVPPATRLIPGAPDANIQYTITATNTGSTDITNGRFTDTVGGATVAQGRGLEWVRVDDCPAGLTCTINPANTTLTVTGINLASADPDESVSVLATARVTCAAATNIDNGQVCNQAQFAVTGQPGSFPTDDPTTPALADATCMQVVWSNLTTTQKFVDGFTDGNGNNQLDAGEPVNFRIRARNTGRITATGVVVTDDVGATGCLDPATIVALDGGTVAGGVITWNIGDLAPAGGSRDVRFSAVLTVNALCCNQGTVQSTERTGCGQGPIQTDDDAVSEDPAVTPANPTCASPGPQPDLRFEKSVQLITDANGNGQYDPGDRVRWTIEIENTGAGAATSAQFSDALSICMRNFQGAAGMTVTTTEPGGDAGDPSCSVAYAPPLNPGTACVSNVGGANGIQPGETVTISFPADIAGQVDGCCNQGSLTYAERSSAIQTDDVSTPGLVDDPTCLTPPPCVATGRLSKTVRGGSPFPIETDLDGRLEVGEGIEYELVFTNIGCGDLTAIRIQDASQACLQLDVATLTVTPSAGVTNNSTPGNIDVTIAGPLAPTQSVTLVFRGTGQTVGNCCNQANWRTAEIAAGGLSDLDVNDFTPEQPTCHDWLAQDGGGGGDPDANVTKSVRETGCQDLGATLNYQFDVDVVAGSGTLNTFNLSDPLAAALTNVVVSPPLMYDPGTNTVSLSGGPIAAGSGETYTFTAQLPCTGSGIVRNTVSMNYDTSAGPVRRSAQASVDYGEPVLTASAIAVITNAGPDTVFSAGEMADFTVTVKNTGTCPARQVFVEIVLGPEFDTSAAVIGQGGFESAPGTVRWDAASTPALTSVVVGVDAILTVSAPVDASVVTETRVTRTAHIEASGHDRSACGLADPQADVTTREICMECAPTGTTQDLLVNREVTNRATVLQNDELPVLVFENITPNTSTCGFTGLNVAADVLQVDVGALLATGVTVPAASVAGPVVYLEVSERCGTEDGGADANICITKDRATGDLMVRTCP